MFHSNRSLIWSDSLEELIGGFGCLKERARLLVQQYGTFEAVANS